MKAVCGKKDGSGTEVGRKDPEWATSWGRYCSYKKKKSDPKGGMESVSMFSPVEPDTVRLHLICALPSRIASIRESLLFVLKSYLGYGILWMQIQKMKKGMNMDGTFETGKTGFRDLWRKSGEIWKNNRARSVWAALAAAASAFAAAMVTLTKLLVAPLIDAGGSLFFLRLAKGENVSAKNVFDPFREYTRYLWAVYRMHIFIFLWSLLLIVPGIIAIFRYSQTLYLMQESPALSAKEAMRQSSDLMKGHKWSFFLYELLICLIFCGIMLGIVAVSMLMLLLMEISDSTPAFVIFLLLPLCILWAILWIGIRSSLFFACFHLSILPRNENDPVPDKEITSL